MFDRTKRQPEQVDQPSSFPVAVANGDGHVIDALDLDHENRPAPRAESPQLISTLPPDGKDLPLERSARRPSTHPPSPKLPLPARVQPNHLHFWPARQSER